MQTNCIHSYRTLLKATVILLPLLGITWVFGILAVNQESSAFAWIFTILNSFQVKNLCIAKGDWFNANHTYMYLLLQFNSII